MTALSILVLALAPSPAWEQDPPAPPAEDVRAAIERVRAAQKKGADAASLVEALGRASEVASPEVAALVAKALDDAREPVQSAAVDALGRMRHSSALDALAGYARRERRRIDDRPELEAALVRALGAHGDPSVISLLARDALVEKERAVAKARILSLGNIRSRAALEELLSIMRSHGEKRVQPYMRDLRISLMLLTSVDMGTSQARWNDWWNEHKKGFEVAAQAPRLPDAERRQWDRFWGRRHSYVREERRRERGRD